MACILNSFKSVPACNISNILLFQVDMQPVALSAHEYECAYFGAFAMPYGWPRLSYAALYQSGGCITSSPAKLSCMAWKPGTAIETPHRVIRKLPSHFTAKSPECCHHGGTVQCLII
eukprot:scaffold397046_cov24-Prasinocladus_malaysianus.AAC.1